MTEGNWDSLPCACQNTILGAHNWGFVNTAVVNFEDVCCNCSSRPKLWMNTRYLLAILQYCSELILFCLSSSAPSNILSMNPLESNSIDPKERAIELTIFSNCSLVMLPEESGEYNLKASKID